jgi:hypothetical protein
MRPGSCPIRGTRSCGCVETFTTVEAIVDDIRQWRPVSDGCQMGVRHLWKTDFPQPIELIARSVSISGGSWVSDGCQTPWQKLTGSVRQPDEIFVTSRHGDATGRFFGDRDRHRIREIGRRVERLRDAAGTVEFQQTRADW